MKKRIYPESLDSGKPAPPFFSPDYGNYMDQVELEELYMSAFIAVFDHPFYAVTDDQGAFTIPNVPACRHGMKC